MVYNKSMEDKELTTTELIDKVTDPRHTRFLALYPDCKCMIAETAKAMGINRTTIFYWLQKDSMFQDAFISLKKDMEQAQEEYYVNKINSIVDSDKTPPQTQLLGSFFMLKSLNSRYKDKSPDTNIYTGDIVFKTSMPGMEVIDVKAEDVKELDTPR